MIRIMKGNGKKLAILLATGLMLGGAAFVQVTAAVPSSEAAYCSYCPNCSTDRGHKRVDGSCFACCIEP